MITTIMKWSFITGLLLVVSSLVGFGNYQIPLVFVVSADVFLMALTATL